jgi:methanogenic corrinoid protein MtbC1
MTQPSAFTAALLDTTLSAHAAGAALCLRERLGPRRLGEIGEFEAHTADLRIRLQYLSEALALGHPRIYLQHVEWLRGAHQARGQGDELLRAVHACLGSVLREDLPHEAWSAVEGLLAAEAELLRTPWSEPPGALDGPHAAVAAELLEKILAGQRSEAVARALLLADSMGESEFVEEVLVRVQRELGRLWQRGEIHVGDEHLGSRLTEEILAQLAARARRPAGGQRVVVASTSGDLHEIGARMVAYHLERAGWDVCFLGANVPSADLLQSVRDLGARVLALSVTLGLHLRGAAATIAGAHALEPRVPVLVGGPALRFDSRLWRTLGADALALDGPSAVREVRALAC